MKKVEKLCGVDHVVKVPLCPYDEKVCQFLDDVSKEVRKDKEAKKYADLQTFAFWIRKANIQRKKEDYEKRNVGRRKLGRGVVFHIAPSNVPVNCLYTYVFGLLAGNSNIVKVPSKKFPQIECACRLLQSVLNLDKYRMIQERTSFVRYNRDDDITKRYSSDCNCRIIWGGDNTIRQVRKFVLPPRSNEITFADRYSFGLISLKELKRMDNDSLKRFAMDFYNDTYLMDQNACSSPHLILWNREEDMDAEDVLEIQNRFWMAVADVAQKYVLEDIKVSEKYLLLCNEIIDLECIQSCRRYDNLLYVCTLDRMPQQITNYRGKFGLFFQWQVEGWEWLDMMSDERIQTCACYGIDKELIQEQILVKGIVGIDRIVPFGKTLDIDLVWDGYDVVEQLSRVIV